MQRAKIQRTAEKRQNADMVKYAAVMPRPETREPINIGIKVMPTPYTA